MEKMGIQALYPKRNLSFRSKEHKVYPYLLRGLTIDKPDQVWSSDITYIRLKEGYVYLTAIIDWYSRMVLSWRLSNTLDTEFCLEALDEALPIIGGPVFVRQVLDTVQQIADQASGDAGLPRVAHDGDGLAVRPQGRHQATEQEGALAGP